MARETMKDFHLEDLMLSVSKTERPVSIPDVHINVHVPVHGSFEDYLHISTSLGNSTKEERAHLRFDTCRLALHLIRRLMVGLHEGLLNRSELRSLKQIRSRGQVYDPDLHIRALEKAILALWSFHQRNRIDMTLRQLQDQGLSSERVNAMMQKLEFSEYITPKVADRDLLRLWNFPCHRVSWLSFQMNDQSFLVSRCYGGMMAQDTAELEPGQGIYRITHSISYFSVSFYDIPHFQKDLDSFVKIVHREAMAGTKIVVIFAANDSSLQYELQNSSFRTYFPQYSGPDEVTEVKNFLKAHIRGLAPVGSTVTFFEVAWTGDHSHEDAQRSQDWDRILNWIRRS